MPPSVSATGEPLPLGAGPGPRTTYIQQLGSPVHGTSRFMREAVAPGGQVTDGSGVGETDALAVAVLVGEGVTEGVTEGVGSGVGVASAVAEGVGVAWPGAAAMPGSKPMSAATATVTDSRNNAAPASTAVDGPLLFDTTTGAASSSARRVPRI
jgi:hypothetical protein